MVTFIRSWFRATMFAAMDKRKVIRIGVELLTKSAHPRDIGDDGVSAMITEDFDGALIQHEEKQTKRGSGTQDKSDSSTKCNHQQKESGDKKDNGQRPIKRFPHLKP